jgi:hypothetical protein
MENPWVGKKWGRPMYEKNLTHIFAPTNLAHVLGVASIFFKPGLQSIKHLYRAAFFVDCLLH